MNASTLDDLRPRPRDRLSRGLLLALVAHAVLVIALTLGVAWRSSEPAGIEAELWAAVPQAAAPRAVEPEPPKVQPAPTPEPPKPTPKVETPPPPPVNRDADIAREKREEKEKLERERLEEERKEAAAKREQEKKLAEQRKAEAEKEKKVEAERLARIEAQRNERLKRIMGEAGATGAPDSTGTAQQSAGPSASYAGRIKARIKPNITFYEDVPANPTAVVEVRAAPDGSILGRRLVKSSGVPAWDDAVLRAIDKTEVLPRDTDGRVPSPIEIAFRPRDL